MRRRKNLEPLTKPGKGVEADERAAEGKERLVGVLAALVAHGEPAELVEPGERALDDPAVPPQPRARIDALARDPGLDTAPPQEPAAARDVVGLVGVELGRAPAGPAARPLDRRHCVDHLLEDGAVVAVGAGDHDRERGAVAVRNNVALRARFAAIRRIRAGGAAPRRRPPASRAGAASRSCPTRTRVRPAASPRGCRCAGRRRSRPGTPGPAPWGGRPSASAAPSAAAARPVPTVRRSPRACSYPFGPQTPFHGFVRGSKWAMTVGWCNTAQSSSASHSKERRFMLPEPHTSSLS